ncbi:MAG: zinc ribbon domain-containing protein [Clostridia bacterium]|jgi:hypothetical protein|nr:zinc ribbon domain-containing protein [Clostridia bacterium]
MDFFNKLGKKASEAYKVTADKTGKLAKEAKLRMKMGELKNEISDIYEDIGKVVYENHIREDKQDISKELEEKCIKIDCLSDEIEAHLKECLELKDKRQCPNCYVEIDKDTKFCPECGAKQEVPVEEPAKEVEIVEEDKCNENENNNMNNEEHKDEKEAENDNNDNKNEESNKEQNNEEEKSNLEKTVEVESDVNLEDDKTVEHLEVEDETENN